MTIKSARSGIHGRFTRLQRSARAALAISVGAISLLIGGEATLAGQFSVTPGVGSMAFLSTGSATKPTKAWAAFCRIAPSECQVNLGEPAEFSLTEAAWNTLVSINHRVNRTIKAVTDLEYWGVGDRWDYPVDGYGDCEDIQLEKRRLLVERGFPARALRIAMVINPEGEGHAVLVARTDRGDYVLDNRIEEVLPWYRTGYVWVKREGDDAQRWVSLGGTRAPMVTAGR